MEYFVYCHSLNGQPFYIGMSKIRPVKRRCWSHGVKYERAYTFNPSSRGETWTSYVRGRKPSVSILGHYETLTEALTAEKEFIQSYSDNYPIINVSGATCVYQFTLLGVFIERHLTIMDAARSLNIDPHSISKACRVGTDRNSAGGFLWSTSPSCVVTKIRRIITQYSLEGIVIAKYSSLGQVQKELGLNSTTAIRNCFRGIQKQAYGFKWSDCQDPKLAKEIGLSASRLAISGEIDGAKNVVLESNKK